MRIPELKDENNFLKRSPIANESTPINFCKSKSVDHGSIKMDQTLSTDDFSQSCGKKYLNDSNEPKQKEEPQKMSLLRKVCFILSFNGGILYVVAFAWLIPCRFSPCLLSEYKWTSNQSDLQLSTNLKTNTEINPSLVIFGYIDDSGGKLKSLMISDGKEIWNNTLPDEPFRIFCNLQRKSKTCFVTGTHSLAAVHSENGTLIWNRILKPELTINKLFLTQEEGNETYLVAISDAELHLFAPEDGKEVATTSLPCSWTIDIKIAGPWLSNGELIWALICQQEEHIEVFTFLEKALLNFQGDGRNFNVNFKSILRKQSYSGSIDLACDVTTTPNSLVLSWADMVTMVTAQAPFHHFQKMWERHFSSPFGYAVAVTSITTGYFAGTESTQFAVAVQEGPNSTIHILEDRNGSSIAESEFGPMRIVSIERLTGADGERDALLVESIKKDVSLNETSSNLASRNFHMLEYERNNSEFRWITTSEGHLTSSLSLIKKGKSNLLLASSDLSGNVILDRFIIENNDPEKSWCQDQPIANTPVIMHIE